MTTTTTPTPAGAGEHGRARRDDERIAEIRRRARGATPGPWRHEDRYIMALRVKSIAELPCGSVRHMDVDDRNAEFIAHARQDVPWLLERLDEARAALSRAEQELADLKPKYALLAAEVDAQDQETWMREHMPDDRAEKAILSAAEAYRLVEEAKQMRAERDALRAALQDLLKAQHGAPLDRMMAMQQVGREPFDFYSWMVKTHAAYDALAATTAGAEREGARE